MNRWITFVFVLFSLSRCTDKRSDSTLVLAYTQEFDSLDPQKVDSLDQARVLSLVYEQLLGYDPSQDSYVLVPELAESLPEFSRDGRTLTIRLRKGVRFSDHPAFDSGKGREVSASDVAYSLLRLADPRVSSPNFWLIENKIEGLSEWRVAQNQKAETDYDTLPSGIIVRDAQTLELRLRIAVPQILHSLTHIGLSVVAREVVEKMKGDFARHPHGTGAYRFLRWREKDHLEFERNPAYWGGTTSEEGRILKVRYQFFADAQAAFVAFKQGQVDFAKVPQAEYRDVVDLEKRSLKDHHVAKGWTLHEQAVLNTNFVMFNMSDAKISRAGVKFRQALSLAIDRSKLNQAAFAGAALPAQGPVPPQVLGFASGEGNVVPFGFNLQQAQALLKASSWKLADTLSVSIYEGADNFGRIIEEALTALGIKFDLKKLSLSDYMSALQNKRYQVSLMTWEADYPDAENFMQLLYGPNKAPSPNFSNFQNREFDQVFEKMRALPEGEEKRSLVTKLQGIFMKELPWAPLFHDVSFYVSSARVKKVTFRHLFGENPMLRASLGPAKT